MGCRDRKAFLDDELRKLIAANAQKDIFNNYRFEDSVNSWRNCFHLLSKESLALPEWADLSRNNKRFLIYFYIYSSAKISEKYLNYVNQQINYSRLALKHLNNDSFLLKKNELEFIKTQHKHENFCMCHTSN